MHASPFLTPRDEHIVGFLYVAAADVLALDASLPIVRDPGRQSRISVRATSECAVGAPFGSLSELIARRPARGRVGVASTERPCRAGVASDVVVDG